MRSIAANGGSRATSCFAKTQRSRRSRRIWYPPSVFVKKLQFVRQYEIREGIAYPKRIESQIDVRVVGRAEVSIEFSNFSKEAVDEEALVRANQ